MNTRHQPSTLNSQRTGIVFARTLGVLAISCIFFLSACDRGEINSPDELPTPIDPITAPTEFYLTENAPPSGFSTISFAQIDANTNLLPGWHADMRLSFDGAFSSVSRDTTAQTHAEVWFDQLGSARRVRLVTTGELIGQEENQTSEAVRLGPDTFLVRNGVCLTNAGDDAARAADLSAGSLIGGVTHATPTGRHEIINGVEAWQYAFTDAELVLPAIRPSETGTVIMSNPGEIWVAPEHNVVVRFYVNLYVENTIIFDRQLAVNGLVIIRYDLLEIGTVPNISIPFGC
jgi:hypothetical protein